MYKQNCHKNAIVRPYDSHSMSSNKFKNFVYARAPLRLSLAGGGTDFPEYFEHHNGTVICSAALDFYVHVNVRRLSDLFDEKYRLEYYDVEHCNEIDEIKNDIIRGVFTLLTWDIPVHISTVSDIPSSSGLGSSSAFTVALILALKRLRDNIVPSPSELVAMAIEVELDILGRSMGIQDCLPAAFGGFQIFNLITRYNIENESAPHKKLEKLIEKNCIAMVWTGGQRESASVLEEQRDRIPLCYDGYARVKEGALQLRAELLSSNSADSFLTTLINVVNVSQDEKIKFSSNVVSKEILDLMKSLRSSGADAQRLIGAGNGGFILAVSNKPFLRQLTEKNFRVLIPKFSSSGAEIRFEE